MTDGDEQPPGRTTDGDEPRSTGSTTPGAAPVADVDAADAAPSSADRADAAPRPADDAPAGDGEPAPGSSENAGNAPDVSDPAADAGPPPRPTGATEADADPPSRPAGALEVDADPPSHPVAPPVADTSPPPHPVADTNSSPYPVAVPAPYPGPPAQPGQAGTRTVRSRRRWPLWTALGLALGLVAGTVPGVLLRGSAPDAAGRPAAKGDPGTAAQRRLGERMLAQLDRQATALVGADRAGFLAIAEPAARPALSRRYAALRALRVTTWRPAADGVPAEVGERPGEWRFVVTVGYCFVVPDCAPSTVEVGTRWRLAGEEPRLTAVDPSSTDPAGVRPWQVNDLAVAVGKRVVVATTPGQRGKLPGLLAQAETAARTADRYAIGGRPPDRYLVYYAGKGEWQRWYGGGRPKWTAGYAVGVGGGRHDVVLNAQIVTPAGIDDLLRHELTHAASLPDRGYADRADWWLVEGLAEYAGADGQPVHRYDGLAEVRDLLRGGWSGRLDAVAPADDASDDRVGGAYGVGYLAVRHLVDRYGEQRMLDFYRAVVHQGRTPEQAADEVFGDPWSMLHDDCVAYVRAVVG
ncbi:hypothetical protein [Micromonospora tulbaghiae]|uniref:Peptidase MA superfamily n=1 Tax=Micromonospora tulbaghiae TaxID=479978 RepID=A0ABY0KXQ7_9ACTN|nr:hypothetical protein [Micromonospora tulbaghiae]MDX5458871.1 hypothetical protein [Micromonospora tulbaghiae]SCF08737.1 Peptidase MA superfamily [Micromonospora tulbaghiae]